jgi:hypothetical protein
MSRALSCLLKSGKPSRKLAHAYFLDEMDQHRWAGVFVLSKGDRVLFFPGFNYSYDATLTYVRDSEGLRQHDMRPIEVDHLSLERDFRSSHFTSVESKEHIGPFRALALGENRYLWFGFSFPCGEALRPLMKNTRVVVPVPASDSHRRAAEFEKSLESQVFQILELPPGSRFQPGFAHITVVAGPANFPDYEGPQLAFPVGSPFLRGTLTVPANLPMRRHRISIGAIDLSIHTTWLPGELSTSATFTGSG